MSTILDLRNALLEESTTPLRVALQEYFLPSSSRVFTYVLRAADYPVTLRGFVQARAERAGSAWNIVCIAPALDSSEDAATVWYRLLLHLCIASGEHHVQRLFACVPAQSPAEEVFRQASFVVYCHERLFCHSPADVMTGKLSARVRPAKPEDRFSVQKLYYRTTPRSVLQAEELDNYRSNSQPPWSPFSEIEQGFVLHGFNAEIEGYLHILLGPRGSWLQLMVQPNASCYVAEILDHAFAVLRNYPQRPLYCTVREYQGDIQTVLEERGFTFIDSYSLLVKHTTVRIREPVRKLMPAWEKRAGAIPTASRIEAGPVK